MAIEFKDGKYVHEDGHVTLDPTVYKDWQIAEEAEKADVYKRQRHQPHHRAGQARRPQEAAGRHPQGDARPADADPV